MAQVNPAVSEYDHYAGELKQVMVFFLGRVENGRGSKLVIKADRQREEG